MRRADIAPRFRRLRPWPALSGYFPGAIAVLLLALRVGFAQEPEAVVSKDAISVHRVERGTMILREIATGSVSSLAPARATVLLTPQQGAVIRVGQACSGQIVAPAVMQGHVTQVRRDTLRHLTTAELEFREAFAPSTALNDRVGALIEVGTADNIVYFERPASARPATTSTIFVLEPDGQHAKRVAVVYGRLSGSQLEIISGLEPGDRVIVTDLPALTGRHRVALK
jgi:multidrug efflux pump subunit AcrA (membrane-fusion protein)